MLRASLLGHLFGNAVVLVIFGYLAAYQGILKFLGVTLAVTATSNLPWWLYWPANVQAAGASGMIWGLITYVW
jgi:membrane associated rhomboid family serine protease